MRSVLEEIYLIVIDNLVDKSMFLASIYAKAQFSGLILYLKENAEIKRRKITKKVLKER